MKRITTLIVALFAMTIASQKAYAETLTVTSNSSSGIAYANYTATLDDGSVLGFYRSGSYCYFCGAISSATSLSVPEKISYNATEYTVNYCGYNDWNTLDFDEATSVTSLTLPATITNINNYIPSTITDLHLQSETPPSFDSFYTYLQSVTVWVPLSAYSAYQSLTQNSNSGWYEVEVHYEGWEPQGYIVTVNTPGTFGNILLSTVSLWTDVDELTVIGHLNTDDLKLLTHLKQMRKLDLSQTDITVMTGCRGLTKLQDMLLPSTLSEVDGSAFSGCSKLKEINIPNATSIGSSAFYDCDGLTTVSLPAATFIGSSAFSSCDNLTTVNLPAATSIGSYAFSSCDNLTTVSLPTATSIGSSAFSSCDSLTTVSLPAATSIGSYAFSSCSSLTTVSLPAATSIDSEAFHYCSSLTTVSLPAATSIGSEAFHYCSSLTMVSLPAVTSIGSSAFSSCYSLTTVNLPACLQSLGSNAFYSCSNLKDVYCYPIVPLTTTAFSRVGSAATLHVPAISLTSYMLHDSWYSFYQIVPLEGVIDQLTVNDNFTIVGFTGLADKVDLTLTNTAHLTVSASSTLNLGTFTAHSASANSGDYYYDDWGYPVYYGGSSLISNNEITADNVNLHLTVQTNRWNFISFPFDVNVSDIEYPEGTLWVIRKYSGADRAALTGNTWQNMTNGMTLQAGEGYILHCANENTSSVEFVFHPVNNDKKNAIFSYQDVVKSLATYASELAHNRSWNLVGNPYPCFYKTTSIAHNGVITVYNRDSYYGSYTAYSLLDDDYVLRPNEAFFVQCPPDATSMTFKAEGRTHEYRNNGNNNDYYYVRPFKTQAGGNRIVYNFTLTDGEQTDRTRLVINPDAKLDYEISCDASKFMSDNPAVPQFYVLDGGIRYAIDERPLGDGIIALGARFGQTGEYTIALKDNPTTDMGVMLYDNETGTSINLSEESYTFTATKGTNESRFILTISDDVTGISPLLTSPEEEEQVYNLSGQRMSKMQKGINIVKGRKILY